MERIQLEELLGSQACGKRVLVLLFYTEIPKLGTGKE